MNKPAGGNEHIYKSWYKGWNSMNLKKYKCQRCGTKKENNLGICPKCHKFPNNKIYEQTDILDKKIENPDTGRDIKISTALNYDDEMKVHKIAQQMIDNNKNNVEKIQKNPRSHKEKAKKIGLNKEIFEKYKHLKLSAYPASDIKEKDIKVNLEGDINSHWILSWKSNSLDANVRAYTRKFLEQNAKIKWKRVQKIKPQMIDKINEKCIKLLNHKDQEISESAAIITIIAKTGLRIGNPVALKESDTRGVSTLGPNNIQILENKIKLDFLGKSKQENISEFEDPEIANFLRKKINENKNKDRIFSVNRNEIEKVFTKINGEKDILIKDLRTYAATKMAKDILEKNEMPPPPVPEKDTEIKKLVKKKLKNVFEQVSMKLNNTPAMAKSSYVDPHIIQNWLKNLGIKPKLIENYIKLKYIFNINEVQQNIKLNPEDVEMCDQYPLPNWWEDENIELVKINKNIYKKNSNLKK